VLIIMAGDSPKEKANGQTASRNASKEEQKTNAIQRLQAVDRHINPTKTARPKKVKKSELPADWSDIRSELDKIRQIAQTPRTETTGYIRQKQAGKLWVRERIEMLLDQGSFREVGSASGTVDWVKPPGPKATVIEEEREVVDGFTPSNNVAGEFVLRG
jgi:hypothetical protein